LNIFLIFYIYAHFLNCTFQRRVDMFFPICRTNCRNENAYNKSDHGERFIGRRKSWQLIVTRFNRYSHGNSLKETLSRVGFLG